MTNLQLAIINTLAYFAVADFPLTKEELYRYLWQAPAASYADFIVFLYEMTAQGKIQEKYGFYFLPGCENGVEKRRRAVIYNDQKLKRAVKAVRLIKFVPFLRAVMVCNSIGREVAEKDSDIDFFVISDKNRLWIVRLLTNFILRLFRLRTYGDKASDRVCLSFFVDTNHLDLSSYRTSTEDIHFAYWLHQMIQIYDPDNWYEKLLQANSWTDLLLPNRPIKHFPHGKTGRISFVFKRFFEIAWKGAYGDMVERQAREMQWLKMKVAIKERSNQADNGVVIKDGIIKLHERDARLFYHQAWQEKLNTYAPKS